MADLLIILRDAFEHFDEFDPKPSDDTPIYALDEEQGLYEFALPSGPLTVGHLRDMLAAFEEIAR